MYKFKFVVMYNYRSKLSHRTITVIQKNYHEAWWACVIEADKSTIQIRLDSVKEVK